MMRCRTRVSPIFGSLAKRRAQNRKTNLHALIFFQNQIPEDVYVIQYFSVRVCIYRNLTLFFVRRSGVENVKIIVPLPTQKAKYCAAVYGWGWNAAKLLSVLQKM